MLLSDGSTANDKMLYLDNECSSSITFDGINVRPPSSLLRTPPFALPEEVVHPTKTKTTKTKIVLKIYFI
jgi:hypothetical protein